MRTLIKHAKHGFRHKPYHMTFLGVMFFASLLFFAVVGRAAYSFAAGSPPSNTARPAISGTAAVGQIMTTDEGLWTGSPSYAYQWQSCDDAGNNCSNIPGATNSSYTLQGSDSWKTVRSVITATNVDGSDTASSNPSEIVQAQLGDFNNDGVINTFDLGIFLGHWLSASSPIQDLNSSGSVDQADLDILLGLYQP